MRMPISRTTSWPTFSRGRRSVYIRSKSIPDLVRWCFILFAVSLPSGVINLGPITQGMATVSKFAGLLFCATFLVYHKRCLQKPHPAFWWFLGYLLLWSLSGLAVRDQLVFTFLKSVFTMAQLIILFGLASTVMKNEQCARQAMLLFAIATSVLAISAIIGGPKLERVSAGGLGPVFTGYLCAIAGVTLTGFLLRDDVRSLWQKGFLAALIMSILVTTVWTGSRGGLGALLLGLSVFLLPLGKSRKWFSAVIWGAFAFSVIVFMFVNSEVATLRVNEAIYEGRVSGRDVIFPEAIQMIAEKPFLGWGKWEGARELSIRVFRNPGHMSVHNMFLQRLLDVGIIGAGVFSVGLWLCFKSAWKARAGVFGLLPLALMITVIINCQVQPFLNKKPTWFVFAFAAAAASIKTQGNRGPSYNARRKKR